MTDDKRISESNAALVTTKLGQPSTSSPRTHENRRRRLKNVLEGFGSASTPFKSGRYTIVDPGSSCDSNRETLRRTSEAKKEAQHGASGWTRQVVDEHEDDCDEGCFVDLIKSLSLNAVEAKPAVDEEEEHLQLGDLPDDLYVHRLQS